MPRHTAWRILRSGNPTPLREVDRWAARARLEPRDRALLRRLVGTEVRRRGTLRALAAHFTRQKPGPDLAAHLRLGLAQIFFLDRVPPHAAVSETVRAAADTVSLPRARVVNAALRAALRARRSGSSGDPRRDIVGRPWHFEEPVFRDPAEHPLLWAEDALSVPAALFKGWRERYGEERASALARAALEEPELSLVVVRGERDALAAELAAAGATTRPGGHPRVLLASPEATEEVLASTAFREGRLTVQGEAALRAAELVEAREGERVLDLCAAPGGKALALAATGADVFAVDASPRRLADLPAAIARLAPAGAVRCVAADGTAALRDGAAFDAILVDAPCTNTGVLAARPEARWRYGPTPRRALVALQARLLAEGASRARPGGRLVYSTCSLEPEENAQQVRAFLAERPEWRLEAEMEILPAADGGGAAVPGPVDGGYAARLSRVG